MKQLRSIIMVGLILFAMTAVHAENKAGDVSLTVAGGNEIFSSKRHIENTGVPLFMLGYNFTDQWGIEGLVSAFTTNSKGSYNHGTRVRGNLYLADGLYHFPLFNIIQPYVLAGVGITDLNPNGNDANNEGNINAGVGAQIFIDKIIALRVEARDLYTIVGGKNDVLLSGGVTVLLNWC